MCQFVDIAGVCTFGLVCNMLVSVMCELVFTAFGWPDDGNDGLETMGCAGSSLSFEELHTVSTKATLFHYPQHQLDAVLCLTFPVLANIWYCLLLVLSWFLFFSCFSHKDRCGVLMTDDNLCPFWGICVPSLINISCHLVVLWMLSIFILVFKVIKTFYGVSVYMGVCLCVHMGFIPLDPLSSVDM